MTEKEEREKESEGGREFENMTEKNFVRESLRKKEPERMRMLNREVRMSEMRALKTKETTIFNR